MSPRYQVTTYDKFWIAVTAVCVLLLLRSRDWAAAFALACALGYFWAYKFADHRAAYWQKRARQREWHAWALGEQ